ncbi:hypothetical protein HYN51_04785 [Limnobaculum parvum]|uniref:Uncharacterized protein n=1 Tax=Limnobaculum parvum TaxID=2172103 RepID=A0A2Y9TWI1_9GAMM|nr:hypothetical protein HYN51_04785 [Limnobaculum parvum]
MEGANKNIRVSTSLYLGQIINIHYGHQEKIFETTLSVILIKFHYDEITFQYPAFVEPTLSRNFNCCKVLR